MHFVHAFLIDERYLGSLYMIKDEEWKVLSDRGQAGAVEKKYLSGKLRGKKRRPLIDDGEFKFDRRNTD